MQKIQTSEEFRNLEGGHYKTYCICPYCKTKIEIACRTCENVIGLLRHENHKTGICCPLDLQPLVNFYEVPKDFDLIEREKYRCTSCEKSFRLLQDFYVDKVSEDINPAEHLFERKERAKRVAEEEQKRIEEEQKRIEEEQKRIEEEQRKAAEEEARRKAEKERKRLLQSIYKQNECFSRWFQTILIIDSNIWMNQGYDAFFKTIWAHLKKNKKTISLYGPQFDEICNVKKKTKYGTRKNQRARCALNRIEEFQIEQLLHIEPVGLDAEKKAYADPLLIQLVHSHLEKGKKVCFFSDDMELRIRLRAFVKGKEDMLEVIKGDDFLLLCKDYCFFNDLNYDQSNPEDFYEIPEDGEKNG